jgi:uncharacterized protein YxjI
VIQTVDVFPFDRVDQIGVKGMMAGKDFYHVVVLPGYDQAFVIGVVAILDNMNGESTRC